MIRPKIWNFDLDIKRKTYMTNITPKQGDMQSNVFRIKLFQGAEVYDLTGLSVKAYFKRPDEAVSFIDGVVTGASEGKIEITLTNQILNLVGDVQFELLILGTDGEALSTVSFSFKVLSSLDYTEIESTNEFNALVTALSEVQNIDNRFNSVNAQLAEIEQGIEEIDTTFNEAAINLNSKISDLNSKRIPEKLKHIKTLIKTNQSLNTYCIGDSTGNDFYEWFRSFGRWWSSEIETHDVKQHQWIDATKEYETLNYKTTSGDKIAKGIKLTNAYISAPHQSNQYINDDIVVEIATSEINFSYSPIVLCAKTGSSVNRGWWVQLYNNASGLRLSFVYSSDGSTITEIASQYITDPVLINKLLSEKTYWRVAVDANNGSGNSVTTFSYSSDGYYWTDIEAVTAAVISIYNSTGKVFVFTREEVAPTGSAVIHSFRVRKGLSGNNVINLRIMRASLLLNDGLGNTFSIAGSYSFTEVGNTVNLYNCSIPGAWTATFKNYNRLELMFKNKPDVVFINLSHNESAHDNFKSNYIELIDMIKTYNPNAVFILMTQNPQISPRVEADILNHDERNAIVSRVAEESNHMLIDIYTAFKNYANYDTVLISGDGIHPTDLGNTYWSNLVIDFVNFKL